MCGSGPVAGSVIAPGQAGRGARLNCEAFEFVQLTGLVRVTLSLRYDSPGPGYEGRAGQPKLPDQQRRHLTTVS